MEKRLNRRIDNTIDPRKKHHSKKNENKYCPFYVKILIRKRRIIMKTFIKYLSAILTISILTIFTGRATAATDELIQMAILLDTSSSMEGLIDQAKSQLWKIVNELALAKKNGKSPRLEVALYEYGKSSIPSGEGYLRMISPLTGDLDKISEELFKLRTNGGSEYCGMVIDNAARDLSWSGSNNILKVIYLSLIHI